MPLKSRAVHQYKIVSFGEEYMDTRMLGNKKFPFDFITPDNIDQHANVIEKALRVEPNNISILFGSQLLDGYKNQIDKVLSDCINVMKKSADISMAFLHHDNDEVKAYIKKSRTRLKNEALLAIDELRQKHDDFIHRYENNITDAREKIRKTDGFNQAVVLAAVKKNIIEAILQSPHITDKHGLNVDADYSLDMLQKKVHAILKAAKGHKKKVVHDIKSNLNDAGRRLLFLDKHDINFTLEAYTMEDMANRAKNTAQEVLKSLNINSASSISEFENKLFYQGSLQRMRQISSQAVYGLAPVREMSMRKKAVGLDVAADDNQPPSPVNH